LNISGLQKISLIDYPEHVACVVFTKGCNLRCPYCHNPELVDPSNLEAQEIPVPELFSFLKSRQGLLDGVCITGGEPTLHGDLRDFIEKTRAMGFRIKLDTNGSRPETLSELLEKELLDYVAMDVKVPLEKYSSEMGFQEDISYISRSIEILENSSVKHEFRTTVVPGIHSREDMAGIGKMIEGADLFFIQNFRPSKHLRPDMASLTGFPLARLEEFKKTVEPFVKYVGIRN
jgi:pyruvate formate lyase activating enzyme